MYRFDEAAWNVSKPGEPDYYNYYVSPSLGVLLLSISAFQPQDFKS